ncbi:MAG: hypothetical protein N2049_06215 [Anaerolineales bacterium]|nr:hypothetical protein [Anaerolineales bacterium]
MNTKVWFLLTGVLLVLWLSACGGKTTPTITPTDTPAPTATAVPTDTPEPTATRAPAPVTVGEISDLKIQQEGDNIIITFKFSGKPSDYNAFHIFVDVDQSTKKGFRVSGTGAEFMLENSSLFAYNGDGSSWSWQQVQAPNMEFEVGENTVSWKLPLADLGLSKGKAADFVAQLVNTNWDAVATTQKVSVEFK